MRFTAYSQPHKRRSPFPQFATYVEKYFIRGSVITTFVVSLLQVDKKKERKKEKRKENIKVKNYETNSRLYIETFGSAPSKRWNLFLYTLWFHSSAYECIYNRSRCLDIKRRSRNVAGRAPTNEFSPKDSSFRERITHRKLNSKRWRAAIKLQINYGWISIIEVDRGAWPA